MFKIGQTRKCSKYPCPVCGFGLDYPPEDFVICPSCGVEFGYETPGRSYYQLRQEWVQGGAHWSSRVIPEPAKWNPYLQMISQHLRYELPFFARATPTLLHIEQENVKVLVPWRVQEWDGLDRDRLSIVFR